VGGGELLPNQTEEEEEEEERNRFYHHTGCKLHNGAFPLTIITLREPKLKIGPIYRARHITNSAPTLFSLLIAEVSTI
jgi:hypothetical protein